MSNRRQSKDGDLRRNYESAALASMANLVFTHPFDTIKTLRQTGSTLMLTMSWPSVKRCYIGFYAHGTALIPAQVVHFTVKDWMVPRVADTQAFGWSAVLVHGLSGFLGFMASFACTNPLFAAKTVLQNEGLGYRAMPSVVLEKMAPSNFRKNVLPAGMMGLSQFMLWPLFESFKLQIADSMGVKVDELGVGLTACASTLSAALTTTVFFPIDTLRTCIFADRSQSSTVKSIAIGMVKRSGYKSFYKGFGFQLARTCVSRCIDMTMYDQLKKRQGATSSDPSSSWFGSFSEMLRSAVLRRQGSTSTTIGFAQAEMASLPVDF